MIKGYKYCHKLYYIKDKYWDLYPELKRKYHNKKNKKLKGKSNKPIKENEIKPLVGLNYSILDSIEAIHLMAANIDINLTVTFFLDFSYSHHSSCQKEDFIELQSYTSRLLRGFTGV